jgi:hypothetical protein
MSKRRYASTLIAIAFVLSLTSNALAMYAPGLGRFCSRDPIGYEGSEWMLYEFMDSLPLNRLDWTGAASVPCGQGSIDDCKKTCSAKGDVYWGTSCYTTSTTLGCWTFTHHHSCCFCSFSENPFPNCAGLSPSTDPCAQGKIKFPPEIPAPFDSQIRRVINQNTGLCNATERDKIPIEARYAAARWYEETVVNQIFRCRNIPNKLCFRELNLARAAFLRGETDKCPGDVHDYCKEMKPGDGEK